MNAKRTWKDAGGGAAVEFALVGPLFVWLLIGLVVYGGWFWMAQDVQRLAAEGARAAVAGLTEGERRQLAADAVKEGVGQSLLTPADTAVQIDLAGGMMRVQVAYDAAHHPLMALSGLVPAPPATIRRTAVIRLGSTA